MLTQAHSGNHTIHQRSQICLLPEHIRLRKQLPQRTDRVLRRKLHEDLQDFV